MPRACRRSGSASLLVMENDVGARLPARRAVLVVTGAFSVSWLYGLWITYVVMPSSLGVDPLTAYARLNASTWLVVAPLGRRLPVIARTPLGGS